MLRYSLLHPPLLNAIGAAGHGSKILIADANYPHSTHVHHDAERIFLNLRPGLVRVEDILETLLTAIAVEAVHVMRPDDGSTPEAFARYREVLGDDLPLQPLERFAFYDACDQRDVAVCVASGDVRLYANLLLTIGALAPA